MEEIFAKCVLGETNVQQLYELWIESAETVVLH